MIKFVYWIVLANLLGACIAAPTPLPATTTTAPFIISAEENPYAPKAEDAGLQTAGLVLTSIDLSERTDLTPTRVQLHLLGSLPSVCNELRIEVSPPDTQYQIFIEVYSLMNPDVSCDNVFQQFEAGVLLGVYSPGRYTVWINNGLIGDFITY